MTMQAWQLLTGLSSWLVPPCPHATLHPVLAFEDLPDLVDVDSDDDVVVVSRPVSGFTPALAMTPSKAPLATMNSVPLIVDTGDELHVCPHLTIGGVAAALESMLVAVQVPATRAAAGDTLAMEGCPWQRTLGVAYEQRQVPCLLYICHWVSALSMQHHACGV